jgi:chemotaxis receptor (MCP) glutamine deamidase CheD
MPQRSMERSAKGALLVLSDTAELVVAPESYQVSTEPVLMTAELNGTLALCLHDERRAVGGLLHLRFINDTGRPCDMTDSALSSVLVVLDRFKRGVLGVAARRDDIQARIFAHAPLPNDPAEPSASLVDLICADFAHGKITCGTQVIRRSEPLKVCFQPFEGRVWVARMDRKAG